MGGGEERILGMRGLRIWSERRGYFKPDVYIHGRVGGRYYWRKIVLLYGEKMIVVGIVWFGIGDEGELDWEMKVGRKKRNSDDRDFLWQRRQ